MAWVDWLTGAVSQLTHHVQCAWCSGTEHSWLHWEEAEETLWGISAGYKRRCKSFSGRWGREGNTLKELGCAKDRGQERAWYICGIYLVGSRERRRGWKSGLEPDYEEFEGDVWGTMKPSAFLSRWGYFRKGECSGGSGRMVWLKAQRGSYETAMVQQESEGQKAERPESAEQWTALRVGHEELLKNGLDVRKEKDSEDPLKLLEKVLY